MNEPEIKMINYLNEHWYKIHEEDREYMIASVTTKLGIERKSFLERWRGEVGNKTADQKMFDSQQKGKRIHHALYVYLNGGTVIFNPWEYPIYSAEEVEELKKGVPFFFELKNQEEMIDLWKLQQFFDLVNPKIVHTERVVYDLTIKAAGTLDIAFEVEKGEYPVNGTKGLSIPKSGVIIADLKTGSQVDESAWSQISTYSRCYQSMGLGDPIGGMVLHTGSKNRRGIEGFSALFKTSEELIPYYDIYQNLASVWEARNPNAGPKVLKFPSLIKK